MDNRFKDILKEWKGAYPADIFPPLTQEDIRAIDNFCQEELGFPFDRVAAHVARITVKNVLKSLEVLK